jgi:hypothetical protein
MESKQGSDQSWLFGVNFCLREVNESCRVEADAYVETVRLVFGLPQNNDRANAALFRAFLNSEIRITFRELRSHSQLFENTPSITPLAVRNSYQQEILFRERGSPR